MNKYGLHGNLKALAGKGEELSSILLEASRLISRAMPVLACRPENGQELNVMGRISP